MKVIERGEMQGGACFVKRLSSEAEKLRARAEAPISAEARGPDEVLT